MNQSLEKMKCKTLACIEIMNVIVRLTACWLLLTSTALAGAADADKPQVAKIIKQNIEYLTNIPACAFRYRIVTGLSNRQVEFCFDEGKYFFKEYDKDGLQLAKMFSFDGTYYYNLSTNGTLVLAKNLDRLEAPSRAWIGYSPLFNPYKYVFSNHEAIGYKDLTNPALWLKNQTYWHYATTSKIGLESTLDTQTLQAAVGYNHMGVDIASGLPMQGIGYPILSCKEDWKIIHLLSVTTSTGSFTLPSQINSVITDRSNGTVLPYSYTISLEENSFKLIEHSPDVNKFRIPTTYVRMMYDADLGIVLKQEDWK